MPNNTANKLTFKCFEDDSRLIQIEKSLDSDLKELDFNKIIPLMKDPDSDTCREAWGTKWNSYSVHKIKPNNWTLVYFFETAWSYPEPIIYKILENFPDVYIQFSSACEGGWFAIDINRGDETNDKIEFKEWNTELGNDSSGSIRKAIHNALTI